MAYIESAWMCRFSTPALSRIAYSTASSSPMLFVPASSEPAAQRPSSPTQAHPAGPGFLMHAPSVATV